MNDLDTLQTGDLVFMHGTRMTSMLIEISGHSPWSHVAMVVRTPLSRHLCLWEAANSATSAASVCIIEAPQQQPVEQISLSRSGDTTWILVPGPTGRGVRLVDLRTRLADSRRYAVARITGTSPNAVFETRVYEYIRQHINMPYEDDIHVLFNSWWDWCGLGVNPPSPDAFFCSELLVDTLQQTRVMDRFHGPGRQRDQPPSEWTVANVAELSTCPYPGGESPLLVFTYGPLQEHHSTRNKAVSDYPIE